MVRVSDGEIELPFERLMATLKEMDKGGINVARNYDPVSDVILDLGTAIRVAHLRIQILHRQWRIQRSDEEREQLMAAVKMFEDDLRRALES